MSGLRFAFLNSSSKGSLPPDRPSLEHLHQVQALFDVLEEAYQNLGATLDAPTPEPVMGGPDGTLLFVPRRCGGDQPACGTAGSFPGHNLIDYEVTTGTYTSVDLGPSSTPEPGTVILLFTGLSVIGLAARSALRERR